MVFDRLRIPFAKAAAYSVIGISLALTAQASEDGPPPAPQTTTAQTPGIVTVQAPEAPPAPPPLFDGTVVTWGDSIGNGLGLNIARGNNIPVVNRGKDGSGLLQVENKPNPLGKVPRGAVVLMSIGTNDVGALLESSPQGIEAYAARVMTLAAGVKAQGATPIVIGMQAPLGPYTGNPKLWNKPGFVETWDRTMVQVNAAMAAAAQKAHVFYSTVQGRVNERAEDNLHYTPEGSIHIANNALRDAGVTARFTPPPPEKAPKTPHKHPKHP